MDSKKYIGMDVHKESISIAVRNDVGKIVMECVIETKPHVKKQNTDVVLGMIERGGKLRLIPITDAKTASIEPQIKKHISPDATLQTDEAAVYITLGQRSFKGRHRMINHIKSYAEGENHTNSIESAFSLLKRGVHGTYHRLWR